MTVKDRLRHTITSHATDDDVHKDAVDLYYYYLRVMTWLKDRKHNKMKIFLKSSKSKNEEETRAADDIYNILTN